MAKASTAESAVYTLYPAASSRNLRSLRVAGSSSTQRTRLAVDSIVVAAPAGDAGRIKLCHQSLCASQYKSKFVTSSDISSIYARMRARAWNGRGNGRAAAIRFDFQLACKLGNALLHPAHADPGAGSLAKMKLLVYGNASPLIANYQLDAAVACFQANCRSEAHR